MRVDTLADGRVVVSSDSSVGGAWRLEEGLRIGQAEGTDPRVFGRVNAVALGPEGRIFVAEGFTHQLRAFGPDGGHLWSSGREGEGPGEFRMISGIAPRPGGELWVMDPHNQRLTVLDTAGAVRADHPWGTGSLSVTIPWIGAFDSAGRLYDQETIQDEASPSAKRVVVRALPDGEGGLAASDSLPLPDVTFEMYTYRQGNVTVRTSVPYSPSRLWDLAPDGDIWIAVTDEYRLHRVGWDGDTLRTVELRRPAPRLTDGERDSAAAEAGLRPERLPDVKPAIRHFLVGAEGRLWVLPEPEAGEPLTWDVFRPDGTYLGRARTELAFDVERVLPVARGEVLVGVVRSELGVPSVVRARLVPARP